MAKQSTINPLDKNIYLLDDIVYGMFNRLYKLILEVLHESVAQEKPGEILLVEAENNWLLARFSTKSSEMSTIFTRHPTRQLSKVLSKKKRYETSNGRHHSSLSKYQSIVF